MPKRWEQRDTYPKVRSLKVKSNRVSQFHKRATYYVYAVYWSNTLKVWRVSCTPYHRDLPTNWCVITK